MPLRFLILAGLCAAVTFAQSNLGSASGVVTDSQGAVIPGAKVSLSHTETGVPTHAVTNDAGFYAVANLQVGTYTLSVEHEGFRRYVRGGLIVSTGQTLGLDVKLEVGAVNETVSVQETPLIETPNSIFPVIDPRSIADLPLGNQRTLNVGAAGRSVREL